MRTLFEMDKMDYSGCTHTFIRNSARSIIIRNGRVAMVHSLKYDYYKFPGGGIEGEENPIDAMIILFDELSKQYQTLDEQVNETEKTIQDKKRRMRQVSRFIKAVEEMLRS